MQPGIPRQSAYCPDVVPNPVLAEVTRGGVVESWHRGCVAGLAVNGSAALQAGDVATPVFPRSASKPLQLVGLLRVGLSELADLDDTMLALAAASHSGEQVHRDGVRRLLAAAHLGEDDLRNVPDLPVGRAERQAWRRDGRDKTRLAMNCSGKHAAMLATCVVRGWSTADYLEPEHPVQRAVLAAVEELTDSTEGALTVDGCGAPLLALSVAGLATGFRRLAIAEPGTPEHVVAAAMRAHPYLIGGAGRDVTELMTAVPGLIAKDGAEGVYVAACDDGRTVALKMDDGSARSRIPVLLASLAQLGVEVDNLDALARPPVYGGGAVVGEIRAAAGLTADVGAARVTS